MPERRGTGEHRRRAAESPVQHVLFLRGLVDPAGVRRWVRERLGSWATADRRDDVTIVVDELVTNACVHARSPRYLRLTRRPHSIKVEVADGSRGMPRLQPWSASRRGGRGMLLVQALSARWGARPARTGKIVWSELTAAATEPRPEYA